MYWWIATIQGLWWVAQFALFCGFDWLWRFFFFYFFLFPCSCFRRHFVTSELGSLLYFQGFSYWLYGLVFKMDWCFFGTLKAHCLFYHFFFFCLPFLFLFMNTPRVVLLEFGDSKFSLGDGWLMFFCCINNCRVLFIVGILYFLELSKD